MLNLIFFFILGAVFGSFLNVCIYRLPRGESIFHPPSHCPHCKKKIALIDLVPIISYVFLRGKCRYCQSPISFRYPLVEIITGLSFVLTAMAFPPQKNFLDFMFALIFVFFMIMVFFSDLETQVVPDAANFGGIVFGLTFNFLRGLNSSGEAIFAPFLSAFSGMILGSALLFLIGWLGKIVFKKDAMGEGDLYLGAFLGAYLGWQGVLLSIFLAYLLAGVFCIGLLLMRKVKLEEYIPFGPALALGGAITLFFGPQIIAWYVGMF